MVEKINPSHVDKIADRIAGAIVDLAYSKEENPKIAVEVLIGHGKCHIIAETSVKLKKSKVKAIVKRIAGDVKVDLPDVNTWVFPYKKHAGELLIDVFKNDRSYINWCKENIHKEPFQSLVKQLESQEDDEI